jgi:hypothetical protein
MFHMHISFFSIAVYCDYYCFRVAHHGDKVIQRNVVHTMSFPSPSSAVANMVGAGKDLASVTGENFPNNGGDAGHMAAKTDTESAFTLFGHTAADEEGESPAALFENSSGDVFIAFDHDVIGDAANVTRMFSTLLCYCYYNFFYLIS